LWAIPAKAVHVIAGAVWLGGLLTLIASWPTDSADTRDADAFIGTTKRVSAAALGAVCLLFVSGTAQTLLFLPTPAAVLHSAYGTIALLKLAGLGILIAFGAYHRRRVLPRLDDSPTMSAFRRSLRVEVAVMSVVVLLGGLLAYVPPPAATS
jgi:putative copper export protein